jgi:hypothetical protein
VSESESVDWPGPSDQRARNRVSAPSHTVTTQVPRGASDNVDAASGRVTYSDEIQQAADRALELLTRRGRSGERLSDGGQ